MTDQPDERCVQPAANLAIGCALLAVMAVAAAAGYLTAEWVGEQLARAGVIGS